LSAKGYQVVADPQQAAYWLQTQVVYCHKPGDDVTPEAIAKSGFGSGLGSGGTPLQSAGGGDLMRTLKAQKAMTAQAMRGGGPPPKSEGIAYLCVADVLMTERGKGAPAAGAQPKTYKMRSVAHILQKDVNVEEATSILKEKFTTGVTGLF
jgi:Enterobacterial TraT complement resistance protein